MGLLRRSEPGCNCAGRLDEIERKVKGLEIEWNEWFDKYRRLYARLAKRVKDDEERSTLPADERTDGKRYRTTNPLARAILGGSHGVLPPEG